MATQISSELYINLDGKLVEIKRQMRLKGGYPFDPAKLNGFLQKGTEGRFDRPWFEQDGIICFKVVSDGTTGPQWIGRLESNNLLVNVDAKSMLLDSKFRPTNGVKYWVEVLKGELFADNERMNAAILKRARTHKLKTPGLEIACLARELFSDSDLRDMGLESIAVFHDPIKTRDEWPTQFLSVRRDLDDEPNLLGTFFAESDDSDIEYLWNSKAGFAFIS